MFPFILKPCLVWLRYASIVLRFYSKTKLKLSVYGGLLYFEQDIFAAFGVEAKNNRAFQSQTLDERIKTHFDSSSRTTLTWWRRNTCAVIKGILRLRNSPVDKYSMNWLQQRINIALISSRISIELNRT